MACEGPCSTAIKIGIIGGSGLDDPDILKNKEEKKVTTPFGDPSDALKLGDIEGVPCVLLARHGRGHNLTPSNINYRANIWALKEEGCTHIIATNAMGSLQEQYKRGDLLILDGFIDRTYARQQTFFDGEPGHPPGVCHLPMEPAYCPKTREVLISVAKQEGIDVHEKGTVIVIEGPRFSSKAESNMFRMWGGDVVNMTAVPEVNLAKEAGICYGGIALVTDYDCWKEEKVNVQAVLAAFAENVAKVTKLITSVVPKIGELDWEEDILEMRKTVEDSVQGPA